VEFCVLATAQPTEWPPTKCAEDVVAAALFLDGNLAGRTALDRLGPVELPKVFGPVDLTERSAVVHPPAFAAKRVAAVGTDEGLTVVPSLKRHHELTSLVGTHYQSFSVHDEAVLQYFKVFFLEGAGPLILEELKNEGLSKWGGALEVGTAHGDGGVVTDGGGNDSLDTGAAEYVAAVELDEVVVLKCFVTYQTVHRL
jgi:hypothetical protein